jgi:circadian clock protein KaiB
MTRKKRDSTREFEELLRRPDPRKLYVLRLYVSGRRPHSQQAIATLTALCREHLAGRVSLEVIDVDENPKLAQREQIFALPTLVREMPEPLRRYIGDLAEVERLLLGLDVATRSAP